MVNHLKGGHMANWLDGMERLVREREKALLGYAYVVCGDPTLAQDLVQDALVKTFSRPREGLSLVKAEAYVRRAITTLYVDQYRRQQRWQRVQHLFRPQVVQESTTVFSDLSADVATALADLPPRVRACVVLRFFDDLTVNDIASQLGLAPGSVKRYLSDGMRALELRLGALDDADYALTTDVDVTPTKGHSRD
jgi:RNA polymerase sigma-70 factor (ECF subfamily)